MPLSIFRRRTLTGANLIGFALGMVIFGMFFLLSLYMQQVLGYSLLRTGFGYLAVALTVIVAAAISQGLVTRLGVKPVLMTGMGLRRWPRLLHVRVGRRVVRRRPSARLRHPRRRDGLLLRPDLDRCARGGPGPEAGLASGLINTSQQIGGALGLAILITVATHTSNLLDSGESNPQALVSGFSLAFWVAAAFALAVLDDGVRAPARRPEGRRPVARRRAGRLVQAKWVRPLWPLPGRFIWLCA